MGDATPVLRFGTASQFGTLVIAGGNLAQPNGAVVETGGYDFAFSMQAGTTSHSVDLPAQTPRASRRLNDGQVQPIPSPSGPTFPANF